ncbi:MAG TPA: hypothetical protein VJR46_14190 [Candidatus Dormibacteraeota bacterium]|nr:hypothetical protein [Candidatus Dormibacteraeota bacterium]
MERLLQSRGFTWALRAEERERRVRGHNRALVGAEEIAGVLRREDEGPIVFADAAGKADDETADGRVLEKQAELVDDEQAAAVLALDARP